MPTQGWGDSWGEMPWGGQTSTGEGFLGNLPLSLLPSSLLRNKQASSLPVSFGNSSVLRTAFNSVLPSVFSLSSSVIVNAKYSGSVSCAFNATSTRRVTQVIEGISTSFEPTNTRRIKRNGSCLVEFIPTSEYRFSNRFFGDLRVLFAVAGNETHATKITGLNRVYFDQSFIRRGWVKETRKPTLFVCPSHNNSIWTRQTRPSTLYAEV